MSISEETYKVVRYDEEAEIACDITNPRGICCMPDRISNPLHDIPNLTIKLHGSAANVGKKSSIPLSSQINCFLNNPTLQNRETALDELHIVFIPECSGDAFERYPYKSLVTKEIYDISDCFRNNETLKTLTVSWRFSQLTFNCAYKKNGNNTITLTIDFNSKWNGKRYAFLLLDETLRNLFWGGSVALEIVFRNNNDISRDPYLLGTMLFCVAARRFIYDRETRLLGYEGVTLQHMIWIGRKHLVSVSSTQYMGPVDEIFSKLRQIDDPGVRKKKKSILEEVEEEVISHTQESGLTNFLNICLNTLLFLVLIFRYLINSIRVELGTLSHQKSFFIKFFGEDQQKYLGSIYDADNQNNNPPGILCLNLST